MSGYLKFLGQYRLIQEIGRGGMGVVYKAWDDSLQRTVALKTMLGSKMTESARERFLREAQLASKLNHPNIIKVYKVGQQQNVLYIAMSYIEGCTIKEYIQNNKISLYKKVQIIAQIADALEYAHQQQVIHRDIKPSNIMIDSSGFPLLMDFGLAKSTKVEDKKITQTGEILGTPRYMAPEQINDSKDIDTRTDIYALAAVLYEILTEQIMVPGQNHIEILCNVYEKQPVLPRKHNPKIPKTLEAIWCKACAKKKRFRYKTACDFATDLRAFLKGQPISAKNQHFGYRLLVHRKLIFIVSILLVIVMSFLVFFLKKTPDIPTPKKSISSIFSLEKSLNEKPTVAKYLLYTEALIKQGFYQQALRQLKQTANIATQKQHKNAIDVQLMIVLTALEEYQKAKAKYQALPTSLQHQDKVMLAMGKCHYHMNDLVRARSYLSDTLLEKNPPLIQAEGHYFSGLIAFRNNYKQALTHFLATQKILANIEISTLYQPLLKFFIGRCYFAQQDFSQAKEYLKQSEQLLPNHAPTYEYLGKIHLRAPLTKEQMDKKYFQKCLKINPNNSKFHFLYGLSQERSGEYIQAAASFEKSLAVDTTNLKAMEALIRVGQREALIRQECLIKSSRHYVSLLEPKKPDLLKAAITTMLKKHHIHYLRWVSLQKKDGDPRQFLQRLITPQAEEIQSRAISAVVLLRYHPDIEKNITSLLKSDQLQPEQHKRISKLHKFIAEKKLQEQISSMHYRMGQIYLYDGQMKREIFDSNGHHTLSTILKNPNSSILSRYLAAKTLLMVKRKIFFQELRKIQTSLDPIGKSLSVLALKEHRFIIKLDNKTVETALKGSDLHRFLLALNLSPFPSKLAACRQLLNDKNERVRVAMASQVISLKNFSNQDKLAPFIRKLIVDAEKNLITGMSSSFPIIRNFSHNNYWPHTSVLPKNHQKLTKLYLIGIKDPDQQVQINTLSCNIWFLDNSFATIVEIAKNTHSHLVQMKAIEVLSWWTERSRKKERVIAIRTLKEIVHDEKSPFLSRFFAFQGFVRALLPSYEELSSGMLLVATQEPFFSVDKLGKVSVLIQNLNNVNELERLYRLDQIMELLGIQKILRDKPHLLKQIHSGVGFNTLQNGLREFTKISQQDLRAAILYFYSFMGIDSFKYLQQVTEPEVQSSLLFNIGNQVKFVFPLEVSTASPQEYLATINHYLQSSNANVRKSAALASTMYTINYYPQKFATIYRQLQAAPPEEKQAAALGISYALQHKYCNLMMHSSYVTPTLPSFYQYYVHNLKAAAKSPEVREQIIKQITYAIQLHNRDSYRYERALLYRLSGDFKAALEDLKKIKSANSQPEYLLEMAQVYYNMGRREKALQIIRKLYPKYLDNNNVLTHCHQILLKGSDQKHASIVRFQLYLLDPQRK